MTVLKPLFSASLLLFAIVAHAQPVLYSCAQGDDQLRTINPNTGGTVDNVSITVPGADVDGCTGLATHPVTQDLHAILKLSSGRVLATLDSDTGAATVLGDLSTGFAGLAFDCSAQLYGVTGDGAEPPETLFFLDSSNADETFLMSLGAGDDGETLGFNPTDGLMYHASGHTGACDGDDGVCFESINLASMSINSIDISTTDLTNEETQALTWWDDQNVFLWKQNHGTGPLFRVSANGGGVTNIGDMDHQAKGLAFRPVSFPAECAAVVREVPATNRTGLLVMSLLLGLLGAGFVSIRKLTS